MENTRTFCHGEGAAVLQLDDALHDPPRRPLQLDALFLLIERDDELSSALADLLGSQARGRLCARAPVMQSRERTVVAEPEWREGSVGRSGLRGAQSRFGQTQPQRGWPYASLLLSGRTTGSSETPNAGAKTRE